jgi:hypothetical protein
MMRTSSINLSVTPEDSLALRKLQAAYADACDHLVPSFGGNGCWNRWARRRLAYLHLATITPFGSQMRCNAIKTVGGGYKAQKALKRIRKDTPGPVLRFNAASVHFDKRT